MGFYLHFAIYSLLFTAGVACGIIHERYRTYQQQRARRL